MPHNHLSREHSTLERRTPVYRVKKNVVMNSVCFGILCMPAFALAEELPEFGLKEASTVSQESAAAMPGFPQKPIARPSTGAQQTNCATGLPQAPGAKGCQIANNTNAVQSPAFRKAEAPVSGKVGGGKHIPVTKSGAKARSLGLENGARETEKEKQETSKVQPGEVLAAPIVILPETTTTVNLSASDLNRIICPTEVKEALTSDEKGLMIKITGKDVFLKYKVGKRSDGTLSYSATPTEVFVVCGGQTYTMIAFPSRMPSQTIRLSSGREDKLKENQALFAGLPFEKRILRVIKEVFTDSIPETYTVKPRTEVDLTWKGLIISHLRDVDVDGEGMLVREYNVSLKPGADNRFRLTEKMFLRKEFTQNPIAVSIDKHTLSTGEVARVFVVEQRADKPLGGNGLAMQLPSVEGGSSGTAPPKPGKTGSGVMPGNLK